jgi:hypothetical protein
MLPGRAPANNEGGVGALRPSGPKGSIMDIFTTVRTWLDSAFIYFFRLPEIPILGYYLGCVVLSLAGVVVGQITIAIAFFWNQKFIDRDNQEMVHMHNLSVKALLSKDKQAYTSCNKAANEAFGKVFFSQIALSISSLWPIPFAAGWLQTRFHNVDFQLPLHLPLFGDHVGFMFTFLPIYILVYILFGQIKGRLPFFKTMVKHLEHYDDTGAEKIMSIADLAQPKISE